MNILWSAGFPQILSQTRATLDSQKVLLLKETPGSNLDFEKPTKSNLQRPLQVPLNVFQALGRVFNKVLHFYFYIKTGHEELNRERQTRKKLLIGTGMISITPNVF